MNKTIAKRIDDDLTKKISVIAGALLVLSIFSYLYFLNGAILNVVERKNIEKEIVELNSEVLVLETEYINLESAVDLKMASELSFVETSITKYVSKKSLGKSLSLNNEI